MSIASELLKTMGESNDRDVIKLMNPLTSSEEIAKVVALAKKVDAAAEAGGTSSTDCVLAGKGYGAKVAAELKNAGYLIQA